MTMRTTGGSPAPPRRRADPFGPPPPIIGAPSDGDDMTPDDTAQVGGLATAPGSTAQPSDAQQPQPQPQPEPQPVEAPRETRREVREARRRRRHLLAAWAIVVAVCLMLTILIVTMARQRPYGLPAAAAPRAGSVVTYSAPNLIPSHGAVAPRGGHH